MSVLVSHVLINSNIKAIVEGLRKAKLLNSFHTSLASFEDSTLYQIANFIGFSEIKKRNLDTRLKPYTKMHPWNEIARLLSKKMNISKLVSHEKGLFSIDGVFQRFDKNVSKELYKTKNLRAVYAYEDGSYYTFKQAKEIGLTCIYDLPIAYWELGHKLMKEEAERLPEWSKTLGGGINDSYEKLNRKIDEISLADIIVTPSSFVADSIPTFAKNKRIIVSQFGSPFVLSNSKHKRENLINRPLRVLFVGSMGQRKGLADLFKAFQILNSKQIELVVMGSLLDDLEFYKRQYPNFKYESTRDHKGVLDLMSTCDVFCLPSIVEGRALVIQEAMSQGLPIIITSNTGGEDLVIEGVTGYLVPIRSPILIAERLNWFIENREQIIHMGENARLHASKYTWDNYASRIISLLHF